MFGRAAGPVDVSDGSKLCGCDGNDVRGNFHTGTVRVGRGIFVRRRITQNGVTYDDAKYTVKVTVTDKEDGTLEAKARYPEGGVTFTNEYEPTPVTLQPAVKKTLEGHELPDDTQEKTFAFKLEKGTFAPGDGAELPADQQLIISVQGQSLPQTVTGSFNAITFTKAGTFVFSIQEDTKNLPAGYDKGIQSMKRAQVTVEDQGGSLAVTKIIYYGSDISKPDAGNGAAFTNRYETQDTVFAPKVQKTLTGDTPPGDKIFTFILKQETAQDGVKMPDDPEVEITYHGRTGQASAQFDEITFTKTGNYEFIIEEVPGTARDGYTYDPDPWTLSVEVEDLGGKLSVKEFSYRQGNTVQTGQDAAAAFENAYEVTPTDYQPMAGKVMKTGRKTRALPLPLNRQGRIPRGLPSPQTAKRP